MKKYLFVLLILIPVCGQSQESFEIYSIGYYDILFEDTTEYKYFKLDTNNIWNFGEPEKEVLAYPEGNHVLFSDTNNHYQNNVEAAFQIKLLLTDDIDAIHLEIGHKYDFEQNKDGGIVEISYDGLSWQNVLYDPILNNNIMELDNFYQETDTISSFENQPGFTGISSSTIWSILDFSKKNEPEMDSIIFIRFICSTDEYDTGNEGWIIEQIYLGGYRYNSVQEVINQNDEIFIYKDQNGDILTINSDYNITEVKLISVLGEIMTARNGNNISSLNINNIPPGIYLIICENDCNNFFTKKIYHL